MPPAKKPAARGGARKTSSSAKRSPSANGPITRKEMEAATKQFEQKLEEAAAHLQSMRRDLGKNARTAYQDVAERLKKLSSDARATNRALLKEIEKLANQLASAAPGGGGSKTASRASNGRAAASKTSGKARTTAKRATASGTRKASTAARGGAKATGAAKTTASRSRVASGASGAKTAGKRTAKAGTTAANRSAASKRSSSPKSSGGSGTRRSTARKSNS